MITRARTRFRASDKSFMCTWLCYVHAHLLGDIMQQQPGFSNGIQTHMAIDDDTHPQALVRVASGVAVHVQDPSQ